MSGGISATTIAMMAATAVSAGAAIMQGQQAKKGAEVNAELQRRQGEAEKDAAVAQAEKIREAQKYAIGSANAATAASGKAIGEGSALRINETIYQNSEEDAYSTMLTGTRRQQYANDQASITLTQGRNAQTAGYLNAASSVLAGGAKIASGWKYPAASTSGIGGGSGLKAPSSGFWGG